mmetsp:Transcript_11065/g.45136  ORF Transcript_11065/g.45136 Transcript_11065/m.45136 type:complete len:389 (-) Transcript_11065:736-1902(-)
MQAERAERKRRLQVQNTAPPTAFRLAERKYKLYRSPELLAQQDFSDVVDFRHIQANTAASRARIRSRDVQVIGCCGEPRDAVVHSFDGVDGFLFISRALSVAEQLEWAQRCLAEYPGAPHHTNLGILPYSIWQAHVKARASNGHHGKREGTTGKRKREQSPPPPGPRPAAGLLQVTLQPAQGPVPELRRLRWATLGYHYDWTANVYHGGALWHSAFPPELAHLVKRYTDAALPGLQFRPEATIVNYYQTNTMLKAHQDESEFTFEAPIVSMSIGCDCIFLLGTTTTDESPVAVRVRSGDLLMMSGDSRVSYHGVPRVLDGTFDVEEFTQLDSGRETSLVAEYLAHARLNINVRQVFPEGCTTFPSDDERKARLARRCEEARERRQRQT